MSRKPKYIVHNNILVNNNTNDEETLTIAVGSHAWQDWLSENREFNYRGINGHFNARKELRRGIGYWYGYRRRDGKLSKVYLGKSENLIIDVLEQACLRLAGKIPQEQTLDGINPEHQSFSKDGFAVTSPALFLAKVQKPSMPLNLVPRPHLVQRIRSPITLLVAPSGYGKSTLLIEWQKSFGENIAWVSLDSDDNDLLCFWTTIITALQTISPGGVKNWGKHFTQSHPINLSQLVSNLSNEIIKLIEVNSLQGIWIVLDNYHKILNPEIHSSLQLLINHFPPKLNLLIASQIRPPLDLGNLRSKGILLELGVDDLRFSIEEGIELLSKHNAGERLAIGELRKLVKRTEGWVSGLVLAANILRKEKESSKFSESFSGAHIYLQDFFINNILNQQPLEIQRFLVKTSILRSFNGSLCDAVLEKTDSYEELSYLRDKKLFVERLDESEWFRYHNLFAETLQVLLREQFPEEIPNLHHRAAVWFSTHDSPSNAVFHLLGGEAWEEAAIFIEKIALNELEKFGEGPRLLRWMQRLPETILLQHKNLLLLYIRLAMISLPPSEVERIFTRTETSLASVSPLGITDDGQEKLYQVHQLHRLWITYCKTNSETTYFGDYNDVFQMMDDIFIYGRDYTRNLIEAETKANVVYETAQSKGNLYVSLIAGGACANLAFSQGYLRRSEQIAHQVLRKAVESCKKLPEPASIALTTLSGVYFERNQMAQANQLLERAIEVDPNPIGTYEPIIMALLRAKMQSIQGDNEAAFATIQTIRDLYSQGASNILIDQDLVAYQALFRLQQKNLIAAEQQLREGWEIDASPFSAFVKASILAEQNRNLAAEEILRNLLEKYPNGFYWVPTLRVQAKLSLILFEQNKLNQATQIMAEAARLAAPEYFVRPFILSGPNVASLLSVVLHTEKLNEGTRSFLKGTLTMLGYADGLQNILPRDESVILAIAESITTRERQILRLLSASLSNQEIADQCVISPSTVKTHLENIYFKLGVSNRSQAIAQARMLNLF